MLGKKRIPLILQMEAAECGAACLAMVLAAHGRWITLEEARETCATSRDGVDASNILSAAKSYGLAAVACRREPETLADLPMPQILHWCFDHFVILEAVGRSSFTIIDPARGRMKVQRKEFGECFTGLTLAFEPNDEFEPGGQPPSITGALMREAMQSRDALAVSFASGLIGVVPALALAGATSAFVDYVLGARQTTWIAPLLSILACVVCLKLVLSLVHKRTIATWKIKIGAISALRGFWRSLTLPLSFFAQRSAGEVVSRLRLGSEVGGTVAGPLADAMPQVALALGYLVILALFDPVIMLAAFVAAAINLLVLIAMSRTLADRNREHQVAEGRAAAAATSGLANLSAYQMLGREDLLLSRWTAAEDGALDADQRLGRWRAFAELGPVASGLLLSLVTLVMGTLRAVDGTLSLGDLVAVQMVAGMLNAPISALASGLCQIQEAAGALMRLSDLEAHPRASAFKEDVVQASMPAAAGRLEMSGIEFGYSAANSLLANVDFTLEPGRLVAVLGPSGAGKSTFARIAAGLIDARQGRVTLDGRPLAEWPQEELRRRLVYVTQAPATFSGTIAENITLWDPSIDQATVLEAIAMVGLDEGLARRNAGLGTKLDGGAGGLSGGEMQRLALSRAIARKPQVLVLDETTSALDPLSEERILDMLRASGAAVLFVTHRPGTALRCDEAILVSNGGIARRGTPTEILSVYDSVEAEAA